MKKRGIFLAAAMLTAAMLGGCGDQKGAEKYVKLEDYGNLEVTVDKIGVDEEECNGVMNDIYGSFVTKEAGGIVDRAVKNGDLVIIDFEGKKDGIAFEGGTAQGYRLDIGSGQFIDGFEAGLVGVMPGETVDLDLTFPENYGNAELKGQPVVFTVTVQCIIPENVAAEDMEDAVVVSVGIPNVSNGAELHQYVHDVLFEQYEDSVKADIIDILIGRSTFKELPDEMLAPYQTEWTNSIVRNASYYGLSADDYTTILYQKSSEDYIKEHAEWDLKRDLILEVVAKQEKITVKDEELQSWLQEQAEKMGYATAEQYVGSGSLDDYRTDCLNEKVLRYLMDSTNIKEK